MDFLEVEVDEIGLGSLLRRGSGCKRMPEQVGGKERGSLMSVLDERRVKIVRRKTVDLDELGKGKTYRACSTFALSAFRCCVESLLICSFIRRYQRWR